MTRCPCFGKGKAGMSEKLPHSSHRTRRGSSPARWASLTGQVPSSCRVSHGRRLATTGAKAIMRPGHRSWARRYVPPSPSRQCRLPDADELCLLIRRQDLDTSFGTESAFFPTSQRDLGQVRHKLIHAHRSEV